MGVHTLWLFLYNLKTTFTFMLKLLHFFNFIVVNKFINFLCIGGEGKREIPQYPNLLDKNSLIGKGFTNIREYLDCETSQRM